MSSKLRCRPRSGAGISASRRAGGSALSCGEVRSSTWRARVCVTSQPAAPSLRSSSFSTWKPAPLSAAGCRRDLARLERPRGVDEEVGQARRRPQADLAALGTVAVFRQLARHGGEGLAAAHARQRQLGSGARAASRGGAGAFGHGDQDLRDVGLGVGTWPPRAAGPGGRPPGR
jgi:hypothetical protein